jgi:hypothetical protein
MALTKPIFQIAVHKSDCNHVQLPCNVTWGRTHTHTTSDAVLCVHSPDKGKLSLKVCVPTPSLRPHLPVHSLSPAQNPQGLRGVKFLKQAPSTLDSIAFTGWLFDDTVVVHEIHICKIWRSRKDKKSTVVKPDVSKERIASILRAEEEARQETSGRRRQADSSRSWRWRWYVYPRSRGGPEVHGVTNQKPVIFVVTTLSPSRPTERIVALVTGPTLQSDSLIHGNL